jgi:ferritin-like metal-binding protein YciE
MSTLQDLYVEQLRDLYNAEKQIMDALPKMERAATSSSLREDFSAHRQQTEKQIERLEQIFKNLSTSPEGEKCKAMEGIIKEGEELMSKKAEPEVLEAGLIASAQRVEHYEIAGYGTVHTWAQQLGRKEDASLLSTTLSEEKATDEKLTKVAKKTINKQAVA